MDGAGSSWTAIESTNPVGGDRKITVKGTVNTTNTSQKPELVEASPSINPTILLLDLKFSEGLGGTVMGEREVQFEKPVEEGQYRQVIIHRADGHEDNVDVEIVHS